MPQGLTEIDYLERKDQKIRDLTRRLKIAEGFIPPHLYTYYRQCADAVQV